MKARLMVYILSAALLTAAFVAAIASQSGGLVGVHKVPSFVCDRVELVPALPAARSADRNGSEGVTLDGFPGTRGSICARDAGG